MRDGWESEAENWSRFARTPGHDGFHQTINLPSLLDLLPPPAGRTLEMGCGEGRVSRVLRARGYSMVGLDAAPSMVRLARAHESEPIEALLGDAAALPFRDETFDLVVAYMALHDFDAMPEAVAEAARVLRPGGRLCLAIPHPISSAGQFASPEADAPFIVTGSYVEAAPVTWTATRGGIEVTFHSQHRPLAAYSGALESAGLLIEAIREVRKDGRWERIPLAMHIRAMRPGR